MRRRTREIWRNLIRQLERSGSEVEEFAAERGIPAKTLKWWVWRLRREQQDEEVSLVPVRVVASTAPSARRFEGTGEVVEAELPDGVRLRFAGAASEVIVEVVARLRRC